MKSFNRAAQFYDGENRCTILLVDFAGGGGAAGGDGLQIAHVVGTQVLLHRLVDPVQESGNRRGPEQVVAPERVEVLIVGLFV